MTRNLTQQGVKPSWQNFQGEPVFVLGKAQYEERQYQWTVPALQNPAGSQSRVQFTAPQTLNSYRVDDIVMTFQAVNSSTTVSPTFRNLFMLFDSFKLLLNQVETYYYMDRFAIMAGVQDYLRMFGSDSYFSN